MPDTTNAKTARNTSIPPFNPADPSTDQAWLPLLSAQDRVTYATGKQTFDKARDANRKANAAAEAALGQFHAAFDKAQGTAKGAAADLDAAVEASNLAKDDVADAPDLDPTAVRTDPAPIAAQAGAVRAAAAASAAASAKATSAQTAYTAAMTALAALSDADTFDPADPAGATINPDQLSIAEAQRDLAVANALPAFTAALNTFENLRFKLWSSLDEC